MGWNNDPELQELFQGELRERATHLMEGAAAMERGAVDDDVAGAMLREGHTIKGTGRVMGFEAISRAGQMLEQVWRRVQHGDLQPTPVLGAALAELSGQLVPAVTGNAETGTPELTAALNRLTQVLSEDPEPPAAAAPASAVAEDVIERREAASQGADLGGLLGALESWAEEETVLVNAGRLYRLINHVAAHRIDAEAVRAQAFDLLGIVEQTSPDHAKPVADLTELVVGIERTTATLQAEALQLAAVPLREVTNTLPQLVRYLAKKTGKQIRFEVVGDDVTVDRQVLEMLSDPIRQLCVNAIEHGVETAVQREAIGKPVTASIALRALVKDHRLELCVEDDGAGVDWKAVHRAAVSRGLLPAVASADQESLRALLFAPGFSTAVAPSELVGDGSGLTKIIEAVEALYGSLKLDTEAGKGTRITITVPTHRALQRALLVESGGQTWGIPEAAIDDMLPMSEIEIISSPNRREVMWHDNPIPVASFAEVVGLGAGQPEEEKLVVIASPVGSVALTIGTVLGSQEVAAKELGPLLAGPAHVTGAALLGGGKVALLVDASRLAERARELREPAGPAATVLVVDDSQGARQVVSGALATNGFVTRVAGSVAEALKAMVASPADALVVDFSMPQADGIALVHSIRSQFGDLPIVMLSGVATPDDQNRARAAGVDAFLDKSDFREGALAETLRALLDGRDTESEVLVP